MGPYGTGVEALWCYAANFVSDLDELGLGRDGGEDAHGEALAVDEAVEDGVEDGVVPGLGVAHGQDHFSVGEGLHQLPAKKKVHEVRNSR